MIKKIVLVLALIFITTQSGFAQSGEERCRSNGRKPGEHYGLRVGVDVVAPFKRDSKQVGIWVVTVIGAFE